MQTLDPGAIPPAARRGFERQLAALRALENAGGERIGWKIAINAPAVQAPFGLRGPLLGHLLRERRFASGSVLTIAEPGVILVEVEVALRLGCDLAPGATGEACEAAIAGLAPALEFLAVNVPIDDLEAAIAGNAFHAAVILGPEIPPAGFATNALELALHVDERPPVALDPALLVGEPAAIARFAADLLAAFGEPLRAGELILCGSLNPATRVGRGSTIDATLAPLGRVGARIAKGS